MAALLSAVVFGTVKPYLHHENNVIAVMAMCQASHVQHTRPVTCARVEGRALKLGVDRAVSCLSCLSCLSRFTGGPLCVTRQVFITFYMTQAFPIVGPSAVLTIVDTLLVSAPPPTPLSDTTRPPHPLPRVVRGVRTWESPVQCSSKRPPVRL
jgi:hypothetical protein